MAEYINSQRKLTLDELSSRFSGIHNLVIALQSVESIKMKLGFKELIFLYFQR